MTEKLEGSKVARAEVRELARIIRNGLLDTSNALVPGTLSESAYTAAEALDRLMALAFGGKR